METKAAPTIYMKKNISMNHNYSTRYSESNFEGPKPKPIITDYDVLLKGPHIWNKITNTQLKTLSSFIQFKEKV